MFGKPDGRWRVLPIAARSPEYVGGIFGMTVRGGAKFSVLRQFLQRVDTGCLKQPPPGERCRSFERDEGFGDKVTDGLGKGGSGGRSAVDRGDRIEGESAEENAQMPEQALLLLRQQIVAPVQSGV